MQSGWTAAPRVAQRSGRVRRERAWHAHRARMGCRRGAGRQGCPDGRLPPSYQPRSERRRVSQLAPAAAAHVFGGTERTTHAHARSREPSPQMARPVLRRRSTHLALDCTPPDPDLLHERVLPSPLGIGVKGRRLIKTSDERRATSNRRWATSETQQPHFLWRDADIHPR